ncbi:hexamerin-like isoform X2 [Athalia rosae]|uniref:hexamerin-like isoform X2 n=1 Tax=Athalia rosae TaxID=37344 RepID=UPI002033616C|nr:hexamerin-like isoform X2 [Athalia rosae]
MHTHHCITMRLSLLLLTLVAAATAVPKLKNDAGNVDLLKKQRYCLLLLQQVLQEIPDEGLRKVGLEYDCYKNIDMYRDKGVVKYFIRSIQLGRIQRKGVPFTTSISILRRDAAILTRVMTTAKDFETFIKTAAWIRTICNEAQFVKAFVAAILQRDDTRGIVLPALYEVLPHYYFDTRIINKAQYLRTMGLTKTGKNAFTIEEKVRPLFPKGEESLAYFTQDIGLANYYAYFSIAGWLTPKCQKTTDDVGTYGDTDCKYGRGQHYYYVHQQLLARYYLERLSNNLPPVKDLDYTFEYTPFKSHLTFPNGLEFAGRIQGVNFAESNEELRRTVLTLERRLIDAIDSGYILKSKGGVCSAYEPRGLDMLGSIIEATGRSINPRYYGSLQGAARRLLGGAEYTMHMRDLIPSALEVEHSAVRDPIFYKLYKRIMKLFIAYQNNLPKYTRNDLIFPDVMIENVKIDKLCTYHDKIAVDIDACTVFDFRKGIDKTEVPIKAVVERLNHKPFKFEITLNSRTDVKEAVVRVFFGPTYDYHGKPVNIRDHRLLFVEMDQFVCDLNQGKNVIVRDSSEAPMRTSGIMSKKDILRRVEDALNSHQPFYPVEPAQMFGFPESLALPKGTVDGLELQMVVIVSPKKQVPLSFEPVVPTKYQTFQRVEFDDLNVDYSKYTMDREALDAVKDRYSDFDIRDTKDYSSIVNGIGDRDIHRGFYDVSREENIGSKTGDLYRGKTTSMDDIYGRTTKNRRFGTDTIERDTTLDTGFERRIEGKYNYLADYYKFKPITEIIGGSVSFDGRPLGYPFDRPLALGALDVPNIKVCKIFVYHEEKIRINYERSV